MMRDTANQAVLQSQSKRQPSSRWYEFFRSAIVAGFESFGLAQLGMCPATLLDGRGDSRLDSPVLKTGIAAVRNLPVADEAVVPPSGWGSRAAVSPAWKPA